MNQPSRLFFSCCAILALAFLSSCQSNDQAKTGTDNSPGTTALIVGTNAEFPPFTFRNIEGEIIGFDIDIAREVGKRLGREISFKDMPFDALIPDLLLGQVDFLAAGMTYTEERAQRLAFTRPYLNNDPFVILTLADTHGAQKHKMELADLPKKTVVVNEGYTADLFLSSQKGIALIRLASPAEAFLALTSGRADVFVTAQSTVRSFFETHDPAQFQADIIENTGETCSLVLSKKNPQLLAEIQQALDAMESDGTISNLQTRWKFQ